jgi:hypothetical protein
MKSTLCIGDLPASRELDRQALRAVRGGQADQANGTSQLNLQSMLAAANVGNGMVVGMNSPVIIQADTTFNQDAHNTNTAVNSKSLDLGFLLSNF